MRTFFAVLALCAAITATAQTAPKPSATTTDQNTRTVTPPRLNPSLIYTRPEKPNEIRFDHHTVDGILVHFAKRENTLQLINPVAPLPYTSMDNAVLDPNTQRVTGWKLFSFSF